MRALQASDLIRPFRKGWIRRLPTARKVLYLTFDDGPIPELTPWVLDQLKQYGALATFFCIGGNIQRNPEIFDRLRAAGHAVGNHTWTHVNGWETSLRTYLRDVMKCQALTGTDLFRPPYGRITLRQAWMLARRFRIVFWDVLSEDFDVRLSAEHCLATVIRHARPGSIIVFHDNLLSEERVRYTLPRTLEHFSRLGYRFEVLPTGRPVKPRRTPGGWKRGSRISDRAFPGT